MYTRRYFIKTVVAGTAGACAFSRWSESAGHGHYARPLKSEAFDQCHAVKDGARFKGAPVSGSYDAVVVGGGASGLAAAFHLRDLNVLLLEKEERFGGSCRLDEWEGVKLSTGAAFYTESEPSVFEILDAIGTKGLRVSGGDVLVVNGQPYTDFLADGADRLPFPQKVRDDFKRSRPELLKVFRSTASEQLDKRTFAELLAPYAPELSRFWDRFGLSNWGADCANTSAWVGAGAFEWIGGSEDPRWTLPGGLGMAGQALADWLTPRLKERMVTSAVVYSIEPESQGGTTVIVRYVRNGEPVTVRARTVIAAIPKYFAHRIIPGIPAEQLTAMKAFRYAPYPVFNVCLEKALPESAYDNWFLDTPFTDFIPAEWVVFGGKGARDRKTALTVYHPMLEDRRSELLDQDRVLAMADGVAEGLEKHFPGTIDRIAEIRIFVRGHPMLMSTPGQMQTAALASRPFGPIFFANTDSLPGNASLANAFDSAKRAAAGVRALLRAAER